MACSIAVLRGTHAACWAAAAVAADAAPDAEAPPLTAIPTAAAAPPAPPMAEVLLNEDWRDKAGGSIADAADVFAAVCAGCAAAE